MQVKFQPPEFSPQDAVRLALELYNIHSTSTPLPGERDLNFHLTASDGTEYVLKIANESEEPALLEMQASAGEFLAKCLPDVHVPLVQKTRNGKVKETVQTPEGRSHYVRLMKYIPGRLMAHVKPHTPALLQSLGAALGSMDRCLQNYSHPAAVRKLKWDVAHAGWIRDYLKYISDPDRRKIAEQLFVLYDDAKPLLASLPESVIYNDANDYNILIREGLVTGFIDFGDMLRTKTICELAVACAYAMLGKPDPVSAACQVVAGYHQAFPISEPALKALYPLICARLCTTVTNAAYQRKVQPDNDYLTISETPAWELLELLIRLEPPVIHARFRHACGLPAVPHAEKIAEWLRANPHRIGRLVDANPANGVTLDLSAGSPLVGNPAELSDVETFDRHIQEQLRAAGASVGFGSYNEARVLAPQETFRMQGNDGPEWRTVHLGLDLFLETGKRVYAPMHGIVHSFHNNSGRFDYGPTIILEHLMGEAGIVFYTLYGHLSLDSLDGLHAGKRIRRGTVLGRIGSPDRNGGWPAHLHFQIIADMLGKKADFPGNATPALRNFWLQICPDPNLVVRIPETTPLQHSTSGKEILQIRDERIGPSLSVSYRNPLHIVCGSGCYLYDDDGQAYLDAVNNVAHVGHCHSRVVKAGQMQMAVLNTNTRYLHEHMVRYAQRLGSTLPDPLRVCFFVNSGSEANELALRLARTHTARKDIVVLSAGYHGNTGGLIEVSSYKFDGPGGNGPPPYVHTVPIPDVYRGEFKKSDPQAAVKYTASIAEVCRQHAPAAFLCEAMPGCGGQIIFPEGYLKEAYHHIREAGGVCIADEVQTGFGRPGTHFWAFETQNVVPDIVTMGKPAGNGHPLGIVVTTPEIAASFCNGMEYFNTFGGNPVSCAIGIAVLDVIADERLQENALRTGNYLMNGLKALMDRFPVIGDVRGSGLYIGVELVRDRSTLEPAASEASYIINRARDRGLLLSTDGPLHNVIKIKPPLVFTATDADFLVDTLDNILQELSPL